MPNNQPEFEVDLAIEHDGHRLHLTGRDPEFTAEIPSFLSLLHFLRAGWPYRYLLPAGRTLSVRWWKVRAAFRSPA
jgi:hypothetical protein